jgi:hypothetical protein
MSPQLMTWSTPRRAQVRLHGPQRQQVAMNVGQDGDAHDRPQVVVAPFMAALTMRA